MKRLFPFFLLIFAAVATFGQQPDRWHGFIIDESTPEQAIVALGKPDSDKTDSCRVYQLDRLLTKATHEKNYRKLEFKDVNGFKKVTLTFSSNKLVVIELRPEKLSPNVLESAYGIKMRPLFSGIDQAFNPGSFERDAGEIHAKKYPVWYQLVGKSDKTFVMAGIGNSSIGSVLGTSAINDNMTYPGKVEIITIVSRTLENKDNVDILK